MLDSPLIRRLREIAFGLEDASEEDLLLRELQSMHEWLWRQLEFYDNPEGPFRGQLQHYFETAWSGYAYFLQAVVEMLDYAQDRIAEHLRLGLDLAERGETTLRDLERQVQEERAWFDRLTPLAVA
ncbi:hypothetical protein DYH09_17255 [bacterium CPR1]|nr:hypothetical protein [bacterium CPR1]